MLFCLVGVYRKRGALMAFGERIRWFRNALGMTQNELGKKLGFNEKTAVIRVGQYENEKGNRNRT